MSLFSEHKRLNHLPRITLSSITVITFLLSFHLKWGMATAKTETKHCYQFKSQLTTTKKSPTALDILLSPPQDTASREKFEKIRLGSLSTYRLSLSIRRNYLKKRLYSLFPKETKFAIPASILIYKKTFPFTKARLKNRLILAMQPLLNERNLRKGKLSISLLNPENGFMLPFQPARVEVRALKTGKILGHQKFSLSFYERGSRKKILRKVRAEITYRGETLVATKPIIDGQKITINNSDYQSVIFRTMRQLNRHTSHMDRGKTALINFEPGDSIHTSDLYRPWLVKKFQTIPMLVTEGNLRIRGHVIALDNGYAGQNIKLKNRTSQQVLYGTIQSDGSVKITL